MRTATITTMATTHWTIASPADLAYHAGRGRWRYPPHIRLLNELFVEVATSKEPRFLIVEMPPRSGKSEHVSKYGTAWYAGTFPEKRVILTSYESTFAEKWGRDARNLLDEFGPRLFGVRVAQDSSAASRWGIQGHAGGMVAVGMGGALTGRGGDLIVIDDPLKNWEEAQSATNREKQWDWYRSTLRTRLEPAGSIILIMTRWHEEDLAGKLLAQSAEDSEADQWEAIRLPALAEPDPDEEVVDWDEWRDRLGRRRGQALWPARFPKSVLRQTQQSVGPIIWEAMYQQRPTRRTGILFQPQNWRYCDAPPAGLKWIRRWDLAATEKKQGSDPDWTAGVLMARASDGLTYIADVRRIRTDGLGVENFIRGTAIEDFERWGTRKQRMSQDPGQSGKALVQHYKRNVLHGFDFDYDSESGNKLTRATPLASQQEGENVVLVRGEWNRAFVEECRTYPRGSHDDMVDAAALAFLELAGLLKKRARLIV